MTNVEIYNLSIQVWDVQSTLIVFAATLTAL